MKGTKINLLNNSKTTLLIGTTLGKQDISEKDMEDIQKYLNKKLGKNFNVSLMSQKTTNQALSIHAKNEKLTKSDKQIVEYLSNPKNMKMVLHQVLMWRKYVQHDTDIYVTLKDAVASTNLDYKGVQIMLNMMNLAGFVSSRVLGKQKQFKVVLKDSDRIQLIDNMINNIQSQTKEFEELKEWVNNGGSVDGIIEEFQKTLEAAK